MPKRPLDDDEAYTPPPRRKQLDATYVPPVTRSQTRSQASAMEPLQEAAPLQEKGPLHRIAATVGLRAEETDLESAVDMIGPTMKLQSPKRIEALVERIANADPANKSRALRLMGDYAGGLSRQHQAELAAIALDLVGSALTQDQLSAQRPEDVPGAGTTMDGDAYNAAVFLRQRSDADDTHRAVRTHIHSKMGELSRQPHIRALLRKVDRGVRSGFGDHDRMHVQSGDIRDEIKELSILSADRAIPRLRAMIDKAMQGSADDPDPMIQAVKAIPMVHTAVQQERDRPDRSRSRRASMGR